MPGHCRNNGRQVGKSDLSFFYPARTGEPLQKTNPRGRTALPGMEVADSFQKRYLCPELFKKYKRPGRSPDPIRPPARDQTAFKHMKLILSDKKLGISRPDNPGIEIIDLSALKIANCVGCFGCWTRTPGRCVIRDDATRVYPLIARSDTLLYVSRIRYGGYDSVMKTMLERAIPIQQAFIRLYKGETHHLQRAVEPKHATIIAYGATSEEEKRLFEQLVARNACNMNFVSHRILFVEESELDVTVTNVLKEWERS